VRIDVRLQLIEESIGAALIRGTGRRNSIRTVSRRMVRGGSPVCLVPRLDGIRSGLHVRERRECRRGNRST
jgi:hypothetical protein